jgi:hypothetical protein
MIRESPIKLNAQERVLNTQEKYYYFLNDSFRDELIKIAIIISVIGFVTSCIALAIALMK